MKDLILVNDVPQPRATATNTLRGGVMVRQRKVFTRWIPVRLVLSCIGFLSACTVARADIEALGIFSFDVVNPAASNGYSINNFTFSFSLPPDFPVQNAVTFKNAEVILTDDLGNALPAIVVGDLGPGSNTPPSLDFLSTQLFQSAEFQATLDPLTFGLADGTVFTANSNVIDTLLSPSGGATLVAGVDFAPILASGTISTPAVPEPTGWLLLVTVVALCSVIFRARYRNRIGN